MTHRATLRIAVLAIFLTPMLASADRYGLEADEKANTVRLTGQQERAEIQLQRAEDVIGHAVRNRGGEDLGQIRDLVTDPRRNGIAYAVVQYGGILGIGDELHAIPWQAFRVNDVPGDDEIMVVLDATEDQFERAEGFDERWPNAGNEMWIDQVHSSWYGRSEAGMNAQASWTSATEEWNEQARAQEVRSRRLSQIIGREVANPQNDDIGEVESILIDTNRGHLAYVIIDLEDELFDLDRDRVALPWHAAQVRGEKLFAQTMHDELTRLTYTEGDMDALEDRARAWQQHRAAMVDPYWIVSVWVPSNDESTAKDRPSQVREVIVGTIERTERMDGETRLYVTTDANDETTVVDAGTLDLARFSKGDTVVVLGERCENGGEQAMVAHAISTGELLRIEDPDRPDAWSSAPIGR